MISNRPSPRFIRPEDEPVALSPFTNPWNDILVMSVIMTALTALIFLITLLFGGFIPDRILQPANVILALIPLALWLVFAWLRDSRIAQPRIYLLIVLAVSALVANAISYPLIDDILTPETWLSLESAITRIIGYAFTVGIVQEFSKYLVVRYSVWQRHFRVRYDSVAYCIACAIGFIVVASLRFAFRAQPTFDVMMYFVFDTFCLHLSASLLVSYGLSETRFSNANAFLSMIMLGLASLIVGAVIPLRGGLGNASFTLFGGSATPILGVGLSAGILLATSTIVWFLYATAERQAREREMG
jgi:protease PrsW